MIRWCHLLIRFSSLFTLRLQILYVITASPSAVLCLWKALSEGTECTAKFVPAYAWGPRFMWHTRGSLWLQRASGRALWVSAARRADEPLGACAQHFCASQSNSRPGGGAESVRRSRSPGHVGHLWGCGRLGGVSKQQRGTHRALEATDRFTGD